MTAALADSVYDGLRIVHGKTEILAELLAETCKFGHIHTDGIAAVKTAQMIMRSTGFLAELVSGTGRVILDEALELSLGAELGKQAVYGGLTDFESRACDNLSRCETLPPM